MLLVYIRHHNKHSHVTRRKMEGSRFEAARFRRVQWLSAAACLALGLLALLLFGHLWTVTLFLAGVLAYCAMFYVCYHPQAKERRKGIDRLYERLFKQLLGYSTARKSTTLSPPHVTKAALLCHKEAQKMIELIMRDFVSSWYGEITSDAEFPDDVQKILEHISLEINVRLQQVDLEEVVCELVTLVLPYLEVVNEAGKREFNGVEFFDITHEKSLHEFESNPVVAHKALRSHEAEMKFYRQALDALIQCAVPTEYNNCDIACTFVRELLLKNIILPLIDLISDPDFLNEAIPMILSKASEEKIQRELAAISEENEQLDARLQHGRLVSQVRGASGGSNQQRRFHTASGRFGGSVASSLSSVSPVTLHRPSAMGDQDNLYTARPRSNSAHPATPLTSSYPMERKSKKSSFLRLKMSSKTPPTKKRQSLHLPHSSSASQLQQQETTRRRSATSRHTTQLSSLQEFSTPPKLEEPAMATGGGEGEVGGGEGGEEEDQTDTGFDIVDLPPIYITRAVHVDKSSSSHTGYILQFPKRMLLDSDLQELGVASYETHLEGLRRYSDFAKFHSTVLKSPLALYCKGLNLPEKRGFSNLVSKLSFGRQDPDPTLILERKQGLEIYLQCMAGVKEVRRSELFRLFLKSAVQVFGEANLVSARPKRKTFLGIVKSSTLTSDDSTQQAEPIPKCPVEGVVGVYLNTHLPLPCRSLHSLHALRRSPAPTATPTNPSEGDTSPSNAQSPPVEPHPPTATTQPVRPTTSVMSDHTSREELSATSKVPSVDLHLSLQGRASLPTETAADSSPPPPLPPPHTADLPPPSSPPSPSSSLRSNLSSLQTASPRASRSSLPQLLSSSPAESVGHVIDDHPRGSGIGGEPRVGGSFDLDNVESTEVMEAIDDVTDDPAPLLINPSVTVEEGRTIGSLRFRPTTSQDSEHSPPEATPTLATPPSEEREEVKDEPSSSHETRRRRYGNFRNTPILTYLKSVCLQLALLLVKLVLQALYVVQEALKPLTRNNSLSVVRELEHRVALSNALLALGSEASERHCHELWACDVNVQLAILVLVGGGMERFLWKELHEVVDSDENWSRALYHLRQTLWPAGKLMEKSGRSLGAQEKELLKQKAVEAFIQFLPNFLPPMVGRAKYSRAVRHCIECLQNPRINRHFLLRVVDVLLTRAVTELQVSSFQRRLAQLRTRNPHQS